MATQTPQQMVSAATCLQTCLPDGTQWAALIYLYCQRNNMNCDSQTLVNAAKCIECGIAPGMQLPVLIYLAAVAAGVDPKNTGALVDNAKCIECAIAPGMQLPVLISLSCQALP